MEFGIDVASEHTPEEVVNDFGVTRERVGKIEAEAFKGKELIQFKDKKIKIIKPILG